MHCQKRRLLQRADLKAASQSISAALVHVCSRSVPAHWAVQCANMLTEPSPFAQRLPPR